VKDAAPSTPETAPLNEQKPKPRASANANGSGSLAGSLDAQKPAATEPTQPRSFTSPVNASANASGDANGDASVSAGRPQ
jgi:hypothetical protein